MDKYVAARPLVGGHDLQNLGHHAEAFRRSCAINPGMTFRPGPGRRVCCLVLRLVFVFEQAGDRHAKHVCHIGQHASRKAVRACFVFLQLLVTDAELVAEFGERHVAIQSKAPDLFSYHLVDSGRGSGSRLSYNFGHVITPSEVMSFLAPDVIATDQVLKNMERYITL